EVHQHGRSSVGRYAAVEIAMLRHIVVAEIDSFGLGNRDSFRNGISQVLTGLRVAHYWSGCLVQHGAYATERGKQLKFGPHFFDKIVGKKSIDLGFRASI